MKICCDACGAYFKTEDNVVCPYCGAEYSKDVELGTQLKHEEQLRKLELEKAKLGVEKEQVLIDYEHEKAAYRNRTEKENKAVGKLFKSIGVVILLPFLVPVVIAVVALVITITSTIMEGVEIVKEQESSNSKTYYDDNDYYEEHYGEYDAGDVWEDPPEVEETITYVTAHVGAPAENEQYRIEVMEMTIVPESNKYPFGNFVEEGHDVVQIRLRVKNNTNEDITFNDTIYFFAEELLCPQAGWLQIGKEPKRVEGLWVPAGTTVEGWTLWQVPRGTRNFRLVIGQYIQFVAEDCELQVGEQ